jgi:PAS domain S-box-containing protein
VSINKAGEDLLGYPKEDLLAKNDYDLFHKEEAEFFIAKDREVLNEGRLVDIPEEPIQTKSRGLRYLHTKKIPLLDTAGRPQYLLGISEDITERKRSEEAQRQLAAIVESSDDAIIGKTLDGIVTSWNKGAERLYGYTAEEIIDKPIIILLPPGRLDEEPQIIGRVRSGERIEHLETVRRHKDGRDIHVSLTISPIKDATGKIIGASKIARDISARKHAEEEIQRRSRLLEAANQELEAFSYSVSHDLRAPLRHIDGFADLLQKHVADSLDDKGRRYLKTISESAKQMGTLVDDLLAFSRMGRTEMRRAAVRLNDLVKEVLHGLRQDTENRNIVWDIADLPSVYGDPAMLRQVLVNLIANAMKYTRTREQATIAIGCLNGTPSEATVFVKDNGVGFDMQYVHKLFGVFQRLHGANEFEGTGIGLANVQRIIHRHGGRVWAEGAINEGATFYFSLPTPTEGGHDDRSQADPARRG